MNEKLIMSLNHSLHWFVKNLINLWMKQVIMSESLNHLLNQFIQNTD